MDLGIVLERHFYNFRIFSEFYTTFLEFFNNSTSICFSLNLPLDLEAVNWYRRFHLGIVLEFFQNSTRLFEYFNNSTAICFSLNLPLDLEAVNWYGGFHLGIEFLSVSVYLMSQALKNKIAFNSFLLSQNIQSHLLHQEFLYLKTFNWINQMT